MNNDKNNSANENNKLLCEQLITEILNVLINLLQKNNPKLSYTILQILINVTFLDEGEVLFGPDQTILYKISNFLGNNKFDRELLNNGLWLIRHITHKNSEVRLNLLNFQFMEFLNEIYEKYIYDNEIMDQMLCCISNLIKCQFKDNINHYLCIIKIFKTQFNPLFSIDKINRNISILFHLTTLNSEIIDNEIIENNIHKDLMNIFPFFLLPQHYNNSSLSSKKNILTENEKQKYKILAIYILRIFGKICSLDEKNFPLTQKLINDNISDFYRKVLLIEDLKIIKNVAFSMSNICSGNYGEISSLLDSGAILELINVAKNIYDALDENYNFDSEKIKELKESFSEINYVLSLTLNNSLYEKIIPYVTYKNGIYIQCLLKAMQLYNDNRVLTRYCISAIRKLNIYAETNGDFFIMIKEKDNNEIKMNFYDFGNKYGMKEIIEGLQLNDDEKVAYKAGELYDEIYDDENEGRNNQKYDFEDDKNEDEDDSIY